MTRQTREQVGKARRWVIKIGSSLLTNHGKGLDHTAIRDWVEQMTRLHRQGVELVLVSSGAVAEGMSRLGWSRRPHQLVAQQAAAAVGQMGLVQAYESNFKRHQLHTAQVLLTHDDLTNRTRYLNARSTLRKLLELGVIPVVNENDTVACDELRFGDNDTLAALVANLVEADLLVILTDQAGVFESDPRTDPEAQLIADADAGEARLSEAASESSSSGLGRGGMATKVRAAELAARSGTATWITAGSELQVLEKLADGAVLGTLVHPISGRMASRKQWLAGHLQVSGQLFLDEGAVQVLRQSGCSLLPVGVTAVKGSFQRGEVVSCCSAGGQAFARGLVNYTAEEAQQIMGQPSEKIEQLLGYVDEPELIHRDNLVLL
ncbi:Glutamate 5-kinase / RNA-binding C-terminal domain PUA [hydrothermal vent metagenome]|uniref:Glutamate 5-kinase / RNA-binding C-terminal domain PUA n=1 Tax=hydrothermal vent metagenome TaxID=652676 RepID=A0A3B0Y5T3_9ZZZZ